MLDHGGIEEPAVGTVTTGTQNSWTPSRVTSTIEQYHIWPVASLQYRDQDFE